MQAFQKGGGGKNAEAARILAEAHAAAKKARAESGQPQEAPRTGPDPRWAPIYLVIALSKVDICCALCCIPPVSDQQCNRFTSVQIQVTYQQDIE